MDKEENQMEGKEHEMTQKMREKIKDGLNKMER